MTCPQEASRAFKWLAQTFNVDMFHLFAQYNDHLPMARRVQMLTNCPSQEAWGEALRKTRRRSKSSNPAGALIPVLQRCSCCTVSTAKVEQSFSKLKRVLGEECRGGSEAFEARLIDVALGRKGTNDDHKRIVRANELRAEYWPTCRRPYSERLDKVVPRPPPPHRRRRQRLNAHPPRLGSDSGTGPIGSNNSLTSSGKLGGPAVRMRCSGFTENLVFGDTRDLRLKRAIRGGKRSPTDAMQAPIGHGPDGQDHEPAQIRRR